MARISFKRELNTLIFAINTKNSGIRSPELQNVIDDFNIALKYYKIKKERRYIIWGLILGRNVDYFTKFFVFTKIGRRPNFNGRIRVICNPTRPLTTDTTINTNLHNVRRERNSFFHNSGIYYNDATIRSLFFDVARSINQLTSDL